MGIKVVRNLLEEVGKGDRHDRPCARDFAYCLIPDRLLTWWYKARNGLEMLAYHLLCLSRIAQWPCNQPFALLSWATQLPLTPWTSFVSELDPASFYLISHLRSPVQSTMSAPSGKPFVFSSIYTGRPISPSTAVN